MLDHVLLPATSCGIDQQLHALAEWIYRAHGGFQTDPAGGPRSASNSAWSQL
jgi:hypothetical protein